MWEPRLKVALVSTPGNLAIAQRLIDGNHYGPTVTHYFKRGGICQKRTGQSSSGGKVSLRRLAMIKDIRSERFEQIVVVELPHGRTKVLPFYALVAILSKAPGKFVVYEDGRHSPITARWVGELIISYTGMFLLYFSLVPLLVTNFVLLLAGSLVVDALLALKWKPRQADASDVEKVASKWTR